MLIWRHLPSRGLPDVRDVKALPVHMERMPVNRHIGNAHMQDVTGLEIKNLHNVRGW